MDLLVIHSRLPLLVRIDLYLSLRMAVALVIVEVVVEEKIIVEVVKRPRSSNKRLCMSYFLSLRGGRTCSNEFLEIAW